MYAATGVSPLTPPESIQNESGKVLSPKEAFLSTLKSEFDTRIGMAVFVPTWDAILRGCEVVSWEKEEGDKQIYQLTLDSAYKAARDDGKEKTWLLEKTIRIELVPENYQILFPYVKEMFDLKLTPSAQDVAKKSLNAIWAWEKVLFSTYTGVGYSMLWDPSNHTIRSDNINDAPWAFQSEATPRIRTLPEVIQEWNDRGRVAI